MIVIYDDYQIILTHHNQKTDLWTICIPIYISPSFVKEIASLLIKCYRYFVPKQFIHPFLLNKNSNDWHEESVKI